MIDFESEIEKFNFEIFEVTHRVVKNHWHVGVKNILDRFSLGRTKIDFLPFKDFKIGEINCWLEKNGNPTIHRKSSSKLFESLFSET